MSDNYQIGDLVWAKMKGFCPWPGRVLDPKKSTKRAPKKTGFHWIYFYGTKDHAWIDDENIKPYMSYRSHFVNSSKASRFKSGVTEIEQDIEKKELDPTYNPDKQMNMDSDFDKIKEDIEETAAITVKKPRKDSGVKRASSTTPRSQSMKRKRMSFEENGASSSGSTNNIKIYDEILNRPAILEVPDTPLVDLSISENLKSKNIEASTLAFGFLGLGIMGSGIVKNLINSGHKVNIWSRSEKKAEYIKTHADLENPGQVEIYRTPSDIVQNSDIVFCCVSDPAAVKDIVYGNCGVLHKQESLNGKGYVEMTNIDCETSIDISNLITGRGGRYLEAQLQGSKQEADLGNLIVLGAGDKDLFDDCHTCFKAIGKTVFYLGEVGFASKMNLVLQVMKGVALVGVAEGFALADRSGLSVKDVLEIFSLTSMFSPFLKAKADLIISMNFNNVEQPIQHMQKDLRLALQLADTLKQPLLMASTANEMYKHTRRLGHDSHDAASVYMRARF